MYLANENPQLSPMLVNMMGSIDDARTSARALDWALSNVRPSDVVYLFFRDYEHRQDVRNPWLQRHWAQIKTGQGHHGMAYIVKHALIHVKNDAELRDWVAFFGRPDADIESYSMAVQEALDKARVNIRAAEVLSGQLCDCLNAAIDTMY
jgi:hypothetical protein